MAMLTGQILLQLIVILLAVQVSGFLCKLLGQQWVIAEILAGLALGPSLLGLFLPGAKAFLFPPSSLTTLQTLGDLGLVLYLFSLGARLDIPLFLRQYRIALITSISSILLPFLLGIILALFLFQSQAGQKASPVSFTLFLGIAMAITAFPVLARLLVEKRILHTQLGMLSLACAAINDIVAWCLLALVISK